MSSRYAEGQVALVTGGSSGIGGAAAVRLARDGYFVGIVHLDPDGAAAEHTQAQIRAAGSDGLAIRADVADATAIGAAIERVFSVRDRIDVAVCAAGVCPLMPLEELTIEDFDRTHAVNLRGTFLVVRHCAELMRGAGIAGRLIAVSSVSARAGGPSQVHYTPTKAGQVSLMQSMAIALAEHRITCNSVLPGTIDTALNAEFLADPDRRRRYEQGIPLGRIGEPGDVAGAIAFLAGPEAAYITGTEIVVDGGALAGLV